MKRRLMEQQKVDLDALEAALTKATPGEWEAYRYSNYSGWSVYAPEVGCIAERWYSTGQQDEIPRNDQFIALAHNTLPALIAELRQLRARITPEPISEKHRDGNDWLVYLPQAKSWKKCWWANEGKWIISGVGYLAFGTPTHALPLPPDPEAKP